VPEEHVVHLPYVLIEFDHQVVEVVFVEVVAARDEQVLLRVERGPRRRRVRLRHVAEDLLRNGIDAVRRNLITRERVAGPGAVNIAACRRIVDDYLRTELIAQVAEVAIEELGRRH
jgi:hypothetical protein